MRCVHCGRSIEPAPELANGSQHRHTGTGWRTCDYHGTTHAEPEPPTQADPNTGEIAA